MLRRTAIGALMAAPFAAVLPPLPAAPFWTLPRVTEQSMQWPDVREWTAEAESFFGGVPAAEVMESVPLLMRVKRMSVPDAKPLIETRSDYRARVIEHLDGDVFAADAVMVFADQEARSTRTWDEWREVRPGPKWPDVPDLTSKAALFGAEARPFRARDAFNAAFAKNPVTR